MSQDKRSIRATIKDAQASFQSITMHNISLNDDIKDGIIAKANTAIEASIRNLDTPSVLNKKEASDTFRTLTSYIDEQTPSLGEQAKAFLMELVAKFFERFDIFSDKQVDLIKESRVIQEKAAGAREAKIRTCGFFEKLKEENDKEKLTTVELLKNRAEGLAKAYN